MNDLLILGLAGLSSLLTLGLVRLCDRLGRIRNGATP